MITLAAGTKMTCADAVRTPAERQPPLGGPLGREGLQGERWYAWAWLATTSPRHQLLIRRHLRTGELAFHYCYVPAGQLLSQDPADPGSRTALAGGGNFRAQQGLPWAWTSARPGSTAIQRHLVLVMAALAICAVTAAHLRDRTDTQAPPPVTPGQAPPPDPGMIPLTVPR